ncbi:MAG: hypothetical protein EOP48_16205 [Sphingobacteriales bacterium]|nr:MAG: hypothetical protein EOP48_16205 [Sphingobacteriales bacterium]
MEQGNNGPEHHEKSGVKGQDGTTSGTNNDYKRNQPHLGESATGSSSVPVSSTQKGGGGSGYDVDREQQEINRQQEEMHQERNQDDLQVERTQVPQPEINPKPEQPDQSPQEPQTPPGTNTMG